MPRPHFSGSLCSSFQTPQSHLARVPSSLRPDRTTTFAGLLANSTKSLRENPCESVPGTVRINFGTWVGIAASSSSSEA